MPARRHTPAPAPPPPDLDAPPAPDAPPDPDAPAARKQRQRVENQARWAMRAEATDAIRIAKSFAPAAILRIVELMGNDDPDIAMRACEALLNRALGKPRESVDLSGSLAVALDLGLEPGSGLLSADDLRGRLAAVAARLPALIEAQRPPALIEPPRRELI